jgi:hypothetical protein
VASDAGEPETVELSGRGTRSFLSVRPSEIDFGDVTRGEAGNAELSISNRGTARLFVQGLRTEGEAGDDFRVSRIGCRLDVGLAPNESCQLELQFRPSTEGGRAGRLLVLHDGAEGERAISLHGTGVPPIAGFRISPATMDFGTLAVGSRSSIRTLTIRNDGKGFLELRDLGLTGSGAAQFQIVAGTCAGAPRIAPASECSVGVRFYPQRAGSHEATLEVRHNAPQEVGRVRLLGDGN